MKIVIPTNDKQGLDSEVADHFGRCSTYTFLNEKGELIGVIENTSEHMGGKSLPPELMKQNGADILLCGCLGSKALGLCQKLGIEVYVDQAHTTREIFNVWKSSKLQEASKEDVCEHHK